MEKKIELGDIMEMWKTNREVDTIPLVATIICKRWERRGDCFFLLQD